MNAETSHTDASRIEALQQAFSSIPVGSSGEDCPEPERLWAAVRLELPPEERREIVRHTATCSACAEDWRVTWALWQKEQEAEAHDCDGKVLNGPWGAFKKSLPQVAAAALVLLAVGVGGVMLHQAPETTFRGHQEAVEQTRSQNLDGASLPRERFLLRWEPTEGATYKIHLMRKNGDFIQAEPGLTTAEFMVPEDLLQDLKSGENVLWQVEIIAPGSGKETWGPFSTSIE